MTAADELLRTPLNPMLRMAAIAGVEATVRLHISRGEDLDAKDSRGFTPLMLAASKDRASVCALLIEAGADPALCDPLGMNALAIALAAGATGAANILTTFVSKQQPSPDESVSGALGSPELTGAPPLDSCWEGGGFGEWVADDEKPPPQGDSSVAEAASAINVSISQHSPLDTAEDWADFEAFLPESAVKPREDTQSLSELRAMLLRAVREGGVPEESVLRVCSRVPDANGAFEKRVRAMLSELGVLPDERIEAGDEPFIAGPSNAEEDEVSDLLSYSEGIDPSCFDPVVMYIREMGSIELLTREGEIEIAKRIEDGLKHMVRAISACPTTIADIIDMAHKVEAEEIRIDELVDGLIDPNAVEQLEAAEEAAVEEEGESEDEEGDAAGAVSASLLQLKTDALERFKTIQALHAKMAKSLASKGPKDNTYLKFRQQITDELMNIRFTSRSIERLCDSVRTMIELVRASERKIQQICVGNVKMPRQHFIQAFPGNETNLEWVEH